MGLGDVYKRHIWRQDPVIICGQGLGLLIYARNLIFIFREKNEQSKTDT